MTAFIILDETDACGTPRGQILVNVDAIIRLTAQGPTHCALLTRSFTKGHEAAASLTDGVTSSRVFVAGSLRDLQIKLNCAAA